MDDANILVTGGTGSFGQKFIYHILSECKPARVVVYSRDEFKQSEMEKQFGYYKAKLRFFLGDIRDEKRLKIAFKGVDFVIHAAALKRVDALEYNPWEAVRTNVEGTANVIHAAVDAGVRKVVLLSTDKAVQPINLYGATKCTAEKLLLESNFREAIFNVVRYGNVMGSRGSVLDSFLSLRENKNKKYTITHIDCTRFWTTFQDAIKAVMSALEDKPGTILIPKIKGFRIKDLIKAIYLRSELEVTGLRPGEKIHEVLVNSREAGRAYEFPQFYRIYPEFNYSDDIVYSEKEEGKLVGRSMSSNDDWCMMGLEEVRAKVHEYEKYVKEWVF
jgi:FlaA1/EpsC-like NDP-sugar epimerase